MISCFFLKYFLDSINPLFSNKLLLFITLFQLLLDILQLSIGEVLLTIVNSLKVFVLKLTEEEKFFIQPPLFRILWKRRFFKVLIQYLLLLVSCRHTMFFEAAITVNTTVS